MYRKDLPSATQVTGLIRFAGRPALLLLGALLAGCDFEVNSTLDLPDLDPGDYECDAGGGLCTLRAAVMEANALSSIDRILMPAGTYNLNLPLRGGGGRLIIDGDVRIQGVGRSLVVIDQALQDSVFQVVGGDVAFGNLTIQGGNSQAGGGLRIDAGEVEITDAVIRDNYTVTGGGGIAIGPGGDVTMRRVVVRDNQTTGAFGGGIWNQGELWVYDSEITENDANRAGGIRNSGDMNLRNVTVSGNTVHSPSAGVGGISQNGFAFLNNVTVTGNTGFGNNANSFRGGGLQTGNGATTVVKNSIIAGNDGVTGPNDCVGSLTPDSKYNLIGDTEGCSITAFQWTYVLDEPADLGALTTNGGTTRNHLPLAGSPARDSGYDFPPPAIDACEPYDQRGVPRPQGAGDCDMGAIEYTPTSTAVIGFILVNADTDTDIGPLLDGDTLYLQSLPPHLSVRAQTGVIPGSVVFDLDGVGAYQTENLAPYALGGDAGGDFAPVAFSGGTHSLRATPYTLAGGSGDGGIGWSIRFEVVP